MASVSFWRYDFLSNLQSGDVYSVRLGPYNFFEKSLNFTVWPFDLSTATRSMEVVRVRTETRPAPSGGLSPQYVYIDMKNVGPDPIVIWYLFVGVISK